MMNKIDSSYEYNPLNTAYYNNNRALVPVKRKSVWRGNWGKTFTSIFSVIWLINLEKPSVAMNAPEVERKVQSKIGW